MMASSSPVALILGAGSNVGQNVGRAFAAKGYRVALAARSIKEEDSTKDQLNIKSDFADPKSVPQVFAKTKETLGLPHVVVYNAASAKRHDPQDPLGLDLDDFESSLAVNTTSMFVAAHEAVLAFAQLPDTASKTFIFTGNCTNVTPFVAMMSLGVGKSASAHIIQNAAMAYADRGYKFYYADERKEDGSPAYGDIDGPAHASFYSELAEGTTLGPWQQTFVKGIGYKKF